MFECGQLICYYYYYYYMYYYYYFRDCLTTDQSPATPTPFAAMYSVSQKISPPEDFGNFFPKWLGIFQPNCTCLLYVPIYANYKFLLNYLQL